MATRTSQPSVPDVAANDDPEAVRRELLYLRKGAGYTDDRLNACPALVQVLGGTSEPVDVLREAKIQQAAPKTSNGDFIDPNTGVIIPKEGPFHYGHKPGFEWWRTQQSARTDGWSRQQVIEYENDPTHYQIEDPASNMSHLFELPR